MDLEAAEFHVPGSKGPMTVHPFYNGESVAIRTWLTERAKLNPPDEVEEVEILNPSKRSPKLNRRELEFQAR